MSSHDARVIAYCLMSSHIHLVLQLGNDTLGTLTKKVHAPFANWVNSERKGIGAVFADRPKSMIVHSDTYGMELIRYVHNNPVRANLVDRASESGWSSHRAYLGLEPAPAWLATDAVLGPDEKEHEAIRHELACYVDEGRMESRRAEFSGEVSKALAKRIRKLMGGDVELSYPVLGPDDFVVSSIKEQVRRHRDRHRIDMKKINFEVLTDAVFQAMDLNSSAARQRTRERKISRARGLVTWLWVNRLGGAQAEAAAWFGVSPTAVTLMLSKLRANGLTEEEEETLNDVLGKLADTDDVDTEGAVSVSKSIEPKVIVMKRPR